MFAWVLTPKATSMAWSACPESFPWKRAIIASAGFPGISRGRKKLIVIATHKVATKKPSLLRRYRMASGTLEHCRTGEARVQLDPRLTLMTPSIRPDALLHYLALTSS